MKRIIWAVVAMLVARAAPAESQQETPLYWWTQAGAQGEWQFRFVYEGRTACPLPAVVRAVYSDSFPVTVCQQVLGTQPVQLPGMARPAAVLPAQVQRVMVIGDTGCRPQYQTCGDTLEWPFPVIAGRAALQDRADVAVHVGDYIYREALPACANSLPCGDNWKVWVADWFQPVGELLPAAPWVFARGNHEDCTRGGRGWFVFFDPRDVPAGGCAGMTEPYPVRVPGVGTLLIMDTSCAPTYNTACWSTGGLYAQNDSTKAIPAYAAQFGQLEGMVPDGGPAWLVTHVPIWARDGNYNADSLGSYILQGALRKLPYRGELPPAVTLSLVGHIHAWEALDFEARRAPVLVLGDGGTAENWNLPAPTLGAPFAGAVLEAYRNTKAYGYTVLQAADSGWTVTVKPSTGTSPPACTFAGGQLSC